MNLLILQLLLFIGSLKTNAQNCTQSTVNNKIFKVCGNSCTTLSFQLPHIKNTSDYKVINKLYAPYAYTTISGMEDPFLYTDNASSNLIALSFPFCFYDSIFDKIILSANGIITFDTIHHGLICGINAAISFPIPTSFGTPCGANQYVPRASIMAVYTDLDARNGFQQPSAPDRKIEYRTEGMVPCRRFIASYYKIGSWGTWGDAGCWPNGQATFQTVLYESTGIVEVYIETYTCPAIYSSNGKAILGMQNWAQNKGIAAPGKNATAWTANQEAYQFIPSGGASRFISSTLYTLNGSFVKNADTSSTNTGLLNISFPNICPINDTTKYIVKTSFMACPTNQIITYEDTIKVIKNAGITATATSTSSCGSTGSITVNAIGDVFTYALNGGTPQLSNVFNNLPSGNYSITCIGTTTGCTSIINTTVTAGNINVKSINDTAICINDAINLNTISNAINYSWQPSTGLNNANVKSPIATPLITTQYIVTASQNNCIAKDTVLITVLPKPTVNAGTDITIVNGDDAQLDASVTGSSQYIWSPANFLNGNTILNPIAIKPTNTILYKLTATTINGCKAEDDVMVNVLPYCIAIKDAFTPNGDGINDLWQVYNNYSCLKNVTVSVYNRYGGLVYHNINYTNNWDGNYNGKPIADGTYYYAIEYTFITGKKYAAKGNVTVLR